MEDFKVKNLSVETVLKMIAVNGWQPTLTKFLHDNYILQEFLHEKKLINEYISFYKQNSTKNAHNFVLFDALLSTLFGE